MAKWTVVDKDGRSVVVDALYARVEHGGCLVAMGDTPGGHHGALRTWAPGEWRTFAPGGEDAYAIVMRKAEERRCRAARLEYELRKLLPVSATLQELRFRRNVADELIALRSEQAALETLARELGGAV